jgi:hypothetical protein
MSCEYGSPLGFHPHLRKSFTEDPGLIDLIQKIEASPSSYPGFRIIQGLLYFRDKLYIPADSPIKTLLLQEFHSSPIGGHIGIQKTLGRLKEKVF